MDFKVSPTVPRWVIAASAVVVLVVILLLGRIGGELHYGNCLDSVALHYPTTYAQPGDRSGGFGLSPQGHFVVFRPAERNKALAGCSRWP